MKKIEIRLEPLSCPSCIKRIEGKLNKTKGVTDARVLFNSSKVKAMFDEKIQSPESLTKIIEKLGYSVLSNKVA